MATTSTDNLWMDDGGMILCESHAGGYLSAALRANPRRRTARTPLGTWTRVTADDRLAAAADGWEMACETCKPWGER